MRKKFGCRDNVNKLARAAAAGVLSLTLMAATGCTQVETIETVPSPNGEFTAYWYRANPGAAASGWDYVTVVPTDGSRSEHELWKGPDLPSPPVWIDEDTVLVGEVRMAVDAPSFNWWSDRPADGFSTPERAAEAYLRGLASNDLTAVQKASLWVMTAPLMAESRANVFGTGSMEIERLELTRLEKDDEYAEFSAVDESAVILATMNVRREDGSLHTLGVDVTCSTRESHPRSKDTPWSVWDALP